MKSISYAVLALVLGITSNAVAKPRHDFGPVVGLDVYYDNLGLYKDWGKDFSEDTDFDTKTEDLFNNNSLGFGLSAGYQFNKYFGLEGNFQYSFPAAASVDFYSNGIQGIKIHSKLRSFSFGADAIGYIPIESTDFSFLASIGGGYFSYKQEVDFNTYDGKSGSGSATDNLFGVRFGIGEQYEFTDNIAWRLMLKYTVLNASKSENLAYGIFELSTGVKFKF